MNIGKPAWFLIGATLGAAGGIGGTYIYMKDKFEARLNEEVNALKAHYIERDRALAKKNEEIKKELEPQILNEFVNYTKMYSAEQAEVAAVSYNEVVEDEEDISPAAEIISDEEWDNPDYDNYRKISVDYFEDGAVYEALSGEELDGFELIAGTDWKTAFGEYTPNVVYVRNHELKTDYEIIEHDEPHPYPRED